MGESGSQDEDVVMLTPPREPPSAEDVVVHLLPSSPTSSSGLTVLLPAAWLSRVPYFATRLKDSWCPPLLQQQQQHLTLTCTHGSSPQAYLRCLQLLKMPPPCLPRMFDSVKDVLELLPVVDHLLFQECWDACMGFLSATPWLSEEEDAICTTVSALNMKPSSDVQERLDTSEDVSCLNAMLVSMLSSPSMESSLSSLCQKCLESSSTPIKTVFHTVLLKLKAAYSAKVSTSSLPREWYILTKILLQFTDAHQVILDLLNSQELLLSLVHPRSADREKEAVCIMKEVLQKVLTRVVPLSNSQRAVLVTQFGHASPRFRDSPFELMRLRLAETLPLNHPVRMDMVKTSPAWISSWFHHLFHRIGHLDEQQVEAYVRKETT